MSSPGQIPPNIIRGSGTVSRAQIIQEQQQQAEQARIDAAQRAQAQKEQQAQEQAARARQNTVSTSRSNPNVFFNEKTGQYDFIVQPTYDDPYGQRAVSRSDVNPAYFQTDAGKQLGKQFDELQANAETQQDFQLFKDLQRQGIDPGVLTINRNAAGDITGGSGSKNNVQLKVGQNNSLDISYSQPIPIGAVQPPNSASEAAIVNQVAARANLQGFGTQFGYAISKDAAGNITGVNSTVFAPASVRQSPQQLNLNYQIFKENQIIKAQNSGAPSAYRLTSGDISALKGAGISDVLPYSSKPNVHYTVNLEDRLSGGPYRYQIDLQDSLSNSLPQASQQPQQRLATAATEPNFFEGFIAGGSNYVNDIPKSFVGIAEQATGKKPDVIFAPSIEGGIMSAFTKAGQDTAAGKPVTLGQDLGEIGKEIGESPGYATGSLVGSAAFFAATVGIGELPGLAVKGIRGLVSLGRAANVERDIIPAIQKGLGPEGKIGIDADKIVSIGTEGAPSKVSVMRETTVGVLKQPSQEIFHSYPVEYPKTIGRVSPKARVTINPNEITLNPDLVFGKPERVTTYTQTFVRIGDTELPISAVRKTVPTGPKTVNVDLTTEIQAGRYNPDTKAFIPQDVNPAIAKPKLTENINVDALIPKKPTAVNLDVRGPLVKGSNVFDVEEGARGENLFIKTQPYEKVVATSETVTNSELARFVKNSGNMKKLLGSVTEDIKSIPPSGKPPSTPFRYEKPQAVTAEQVRANFIPNEAATKGSNTVINKGISAGVAKSLGSFGLGKQQASNRGVSLGVGGVTGAERKQSKGLVEDVTTEILRTPKSSTKSIAQQFTDQFKQPVSRSDNGVLGKSLFDLVQIPKINSRENQGNRGLNDLLTGLNQKEIPLLTPLQTPLTTPLTTPITTPFQIPVETPTITQIPRFDIPTVPKTPNVPHIPTITFEFPFSMNPTPKKKKGKKKEPKYGERAFKRTDIVANSVSSEIAKMINSAIGKVE